MMKSLGLIVAALFLSGPLSAQNFEGKIIYQVSFKSKLPNVTDEQLALIMGANQEYFIKDANYKTVANGTLLKWQIFVSKDNKIYRKMANSEALLWNDVTVDTDPLIKAEINKNVVKILGHPCDEIVLTSKNSTVKYYFSSEFKVNPELFVNHKMGHLDELTRRSNALPLKMIISAPQFVLESEAKEILPMKLEDSIFMLPPGVKTEKSPF